MFNLGEGIYERAMEKGIEKGIEKVLNKKSGILKEKNGKPHSKCSKTGYPLNRFPGI